MTAKGQAWQDRKDGKIPAWQGPATNSEPSSSSSAAPLPPPMTPAQAAAAASAAAVAAAGAAAGAAAAVQNDAANDPVALMINAGQVAMAAQTDAAGTARMPGQAGRGTLVPPPRQVRPPTTIQPRQSPTMTLCVPMGNSSTSSNGRVVGDFMLGQLFQRYENQLQLLRSEVTHLHTEVAQLSSALDVLANDLPDTEDSGQPT